uniref:Uncharacterized protein n=1 Tax=Tanacetum cinerariifolium TaxID=118510 RepID=A0A6L2N4J7_TANCI|nr:hypothetical protein [Tanacetum cinerariifolium]
MSRDVITVGSTMRISLLYRGEYSQWHERFMNYLEEQTDGEAMINSIQNGDQPLPVIAQVSLVGNAQNATPTLKDLKFWSAKKKKTRIDRLERSLLIQGLPNDIYSLIDSNKTAKDLWDALERQMRGSEYGEQDRKAVILYEYETFKANKGEHLLDTYLRYLQVINDLKKCGYKKDNCELNYKFLNNLQPEWKQYGTLMRQTKNLMDINIDALYNILKQNQGDVNDALRYKKKAVVVTSDPLALVAKKTKTEGHFAKDCKKAKVKDYNYYKTKMLLAKKDSDEQVLLAEDQAWMESSSDSDQEINANMVFMAQIEKFLSKSDESSSSAEETITEQTSSLKPYVSNVILEKIIIDLEDEVVSHLEKEKANLETIESLKSKDLDTFSSVRRPSHSGVIWKKKGSSNTSNADLSCVSHLKLNKDVKRYSHKDLLSCNNSHLGETRSAYVCNDAMHVSCNSRMCDLFDENNLFIFDDERVRISPVSKMLVKKKPRDCMNIVQICLWIIDSGCSKHMTEINANMVFMAQIEKVLSDSKVSSSSADEKISESAYFDNDKQHRKHIADQEVLFDKMSVQLEELDKHVRDLKNTVLEKDFKISELEEYVHNKDLEIKKCLERLNVCENKLHKMGQTNQIVHMIMPSKDNLYNGRKGIGFENPSYFEKEKDLRPTLYDEKVIGLGCYLLNDYEDVGKLKAKWDIGVFIGYSKEFVAFRIYNKRTRKIHESVNVNFDEILEMASKQFSLEPGLSNLNKTGKSSNPSVLQVSETSKKYLEDLFQDFYDEYFDSSKIMKSSTTNVETSNVKIPSHEEEVFHEVSESFQGEYSASPLNDDVQQCSEEVILPQTNTQLISNNMVSNVDETKDHPLHKIIGDPKSNVRTRGQLANSCLFSCLLSSIKPANVAEVLKDVDWVSAMQDELDQFARLKVWRLVPRPEGKTIIKTKWIFKNKKDESSLVIRNKARLVAVGYSHQEGIDYDETFAPVT